MPDHLAAMPSPDLQPTCLQGSLLSHGFQLETHAVRNSHRKGVDVCGRDITPTNIAVYSFSDQEPVEGSI